MHSFSNAWLPPRMRLWVSERPSMLVWTETLSLSVIARSDGSGSEYRFVATRTSHINSDAVDRMCENAGCIVGSPPVRRTEYVPLLAKYCKVAMA